MWPFYIFMDTSVSERQLEDFIFNSDRKTLGDAGLNAHHWVYRYRQLNLDKFGIIDILAMDYNSYSDFIPIKDSNAKNEIYRRDLHINVIELKANNIDNSTMIKAESMCYILNSPEEFCIKRIETF